MKGTIAKEREAWVVEARPSPALGVNHQHWLSLRYDYYCGEWRHWWHERLALEHPPLLFWSRPASA